MAISKRDYKKIIALCLLCLFIGGITGFYFGADMAIKRIVSIGQHFINIDNEMVKAAIFNYRNSINACFNQS